MTVITLRNEVTVVARSSYRYDRTVEIAGHVVRARIERNYFSSYSRAVVETIMDEKARRPVVEDTERLWWNTTPPPNTYPDAVAVLGPVADELLRRAATVLTAAPRVLSPHLLGAISALLATTSGYDGERRIDPDEIERATARGGSLHIIEHPDGGVTFTQAHHDECPFITSSGAQNCDDECSFEHLADADRRRDL